MKQAARDQDINIDSLQRRRNSCSADRNIDYPTSKMAGNFVTLVFKGERCPNDWERLAINLVVTINRRAAPRCWCVDRWGMLRRLSPRGCCDPRRVYGRRKIQIHRGEVVCRDPP